MTSNYLSHLRAAIGKREDQRILDWLLDTYVRALPAMIRRSGQVECGVPHDNRHDGEACGKCRAVV